MCLIPLFFLVRKKNMEIGEIIIALGAFGLALWYLYRKFVVTKGCSCGNKSCSSASSGKYSAADPGKND